MMTEDIDNIILEHLKRFQFWQERIERKLKEIKNRITTLESSSATIMQHLAHLTGSAADQHVRYDNLADRIERIERRLEIS